MCITGATQFATENHHFWEVSKVSPDKCPPLSQAKQEKFPFLISIYPLLVQHDLPQKTTTFERWWKQAIEKYTYTPLSWEKQEKFSYRAKGLGLGLDNISARSDSRSESKFIHPTLRPAQGLEIYDGLKGFWETPV